MRKLHNSNLAELHNIYSMCLEILKLYIFRWVLQNIIMQFAQIFEIIIIKEIKDGDTTGIFV